MRARTIPTWSSRRFLDNVDFGVADAFALQQRAGAGAIGTEHRRVKLDFSHSGGNSKSGSCGRACPSIKTTASGCQAPRPGAGRDYPPTRNARANAKHSTDAPTRL